MWEMFPSYWKESMPESGVSAYYFTVYECTYVCAQVVHVYICIEARGQLQGRFLGVAHLGL